MSSDHVNIQWEFIWFAPALCLKILYGHLVREEPYRPAEVNAR